MEHNNENSSDQHERLTTLEEVVFGNVRTGEKGMKQKVDEMHEVLIGFKGVKGFFGAVVLIGAVLFAIKAWIFKELP